NNVSEDLGKDATDYNSMYVLDRQEELLEKFKSHLNPSKNNRSKILYNQNSTWECEIVNIQSYGIFVEFGINGSGLIHISQFEKANKMIEDYALGDKIKASIIEYSHSHYRYKLNYIEDAPNS